MVSAADLKAELLKTFPSLDPTMDEVALYIHAHPELAFGEVEAVRVLTEHLRGSGFAIERPIAGLDTAFVARRPGGAGPGPRVAILVQYDALEGLGHACGHNLIAAGGLGAALALAPVMDRLPGELLVVGCPAEEGGGGKVIMAEAGVFDDLDAALMFHGYDRTSVLLYYNAVTHLTIEFAGRAAHAGAAPWDGVNALEAVMLMFQGINSLRQHVRPETRIHGKITDGGAAPNVIHERAAATLLVRTPDSAYNEQVVARVIDCARGAALMTGAKVDVRTESAYKEMLNNVALGEVFAGNLEALGVEMDSFEHVSTASTDMGDVSFAVPTIYPVFHIGDCLPHTREFLEASASEAGLGAMRSAARAVALTVVDVLSDPETAKRIRAEFAAKVGGELL